MKTEKKNKQRMDRCPDWEKHTTGIGSKLLIKCGFRGRLGAKEDGIEAPIEPKGNANRTGLGFSDVQRSEEETLTSKMNSMKLEEIDLKALWEEFINLCLQYKNGPRLEQEFISALNEKMNEENNSFFEYWQLFDPIFTYMNQHPVDTFEPDIIVKLRRLKRQGFLPFTKRSSPDLPLFNFSYESIEPPTVSMAGKKRDSYDARSTSDLHDEIERREHIRRQRLIDSLQVVEANDTHWWENIDLLARYYEVYGSFSVPTDVIVIRGDGSIFHLGIWLQLEREKLPNYYLRDYERYNALTDLMARGLWTES